MVLWPVPCVDPVTLVVSSVVSDVEVIDLVLEDVLFEVIWIYGDLASWLGFLGVRCHETGAAYSTELNQFRH